MTLALLDPDHHTLTVEVGNLQMKGLAHAQSGAVHRAEDHVVRKGGSGFQNLQDLFRAKDHRQLVFLLGERDHFDDPILLQSDVVEKPKGADRHGPAADPHLPFLGQVDLIAADLFRT
jgi:hypothetical protein